MIKRGIEWYEGSRACVIECSLKKIGWAREEENEGQAELSEGVLRSEPWGRSQGSSSTRSST